MISKLSTEACHLDRLAWTETTHVDTRRGTDEDRTLDGIWGSWGIDASGTEKAKHVSGRGIEGNYTATVTNPDGTPYQTHIAVRATGRSHKFAWSNNSEGFGVRLGDNIAVGFGGEHCGFVAYHLMPDGSLDGIWGGASHQTGTEKARKQ